MVSRMNKIRLVPPLYPAPWSLSENDHFYFIRPVAVDEVNWPLSSYRYGGTFFAPDAPHTGVADEVAHCAPVRARGGQLDGDCWR